MPPTIHCIRHAQGYHNLSTANQSIHDPSLTPLGIQQCHTLTSSFPHTSSIDLLVASPLRRTLYTALYSFPSKATSGIPLIALPEIQETSDLPCDTGSSRADLEKEFEGKNVDLKLVTDDWNDKKGRWSPARPAVEERCRIARNWLKERKEKDIVVVTHGGVLHYLTEDWFEHDKFHGTGWANTEYRSYTFAATTDDAEASLIETEDSRTRRRGTEKPLGEAEQRNLKEVAHKNWETSGFARPEAEGKGKI